jgi:protein FrlC
VDNAVTGKVRRGNYAYRLYIFVYFLCSMERLGIRAIELWAAGPHFYLDDFSDGMIRSLGRQILEHALSVICLTPEQCAYPINIAACEVYIRERSIRYFERAIQAAAIPGFRLFLSRAWSRLQE